MLLKPEYQENYIKDTAADALAPCVTMPSEVTVWALIWVFFVTWKWIVISCDGFLVKLWYQMEICFSKFAKKRHRDMGSWS